MPEHPHFEEDDLFNPETHHESSDVNVRALLWFMVIFVAFAVLTHVVLFALFKGFAKMERRGTPALTSLPRPADMAVPKNQPLLEPFPTKVGDRVMQPVSDTPVTHLADMRKAENDALSTYGWVDQQKGIVRVPIEVAKQIALQRGYPVASQSSTVLSGAPPPPATPVDGVRVEPRTTGARP